MTRQQLEHIIRAAGSITDEKVILVLGSQSILGSVENASKKLLLSMEADVFPLKAPDKMELINGSIGEISQYHETFGYYAHGIPPDSCPLPAGWEKRLATIQNENTNGIIGLCLGADDLACTKLVAGRPKDLDFVTEMISTGVAKSKELGKLIADLPLNDQKLAAQRSLLVVEHRIKSREFARSKEIETPSKDIGLEKDRDELSL